MNLYSNPVAKAQQQKEKRASRKKTRNFFYIYNMTVKHTLLAAGLGLAFIFTTGCAGKKAEASKIEQEKAQIQRDRNLNANVDIMLDE